MYRNVILNFSKMIFFENSLPTSNQTTEASFFRIIFLRGSFSQKLFKLFVKIKINKIKIFFHTKKTADPYDIADDFNMTYVMY